MAPGSGSGRERNTDQGTCPTPRRPPARPGGLDCGDFSTRPVQSETSLSLCVRFCLLVAWGGGSLADRVCPAPLELPHPTSREDPARLPPSQPVGTIPSCIERQRRDRRRGHTKLDTGEWSYQPTRHRLAEWSSPQWMASRKATNRSWAKWTDHMVLTALWIPSVDHTITLWSEHTRLDHGLAGLYLGFHVPRNKAGPQRVDPM